MKKILISEKNFNKCYLTDSSKYNSNNIVGYDTEQSYDGIQDKYISFFNSFAFWIIFSRSKSCSDI